MKFSLKLLRFRGTIFWYSDCSKQGVPAHWPFYRLSSWLLLLPLGSCWLFVSLKTRSSLQLLPWGLTGENILWHNLTWCPHQPLNSWDLPKLQNLFQVRRCSFLTLCQVIFAWIKTARQPLSHVNLYKNKQYAKVALSCNLSLLLLHASVPNQCFTVQHSSKLLCRFHYVGLKRITPIHVSYAHPQLHEALKHCNI